MSSHVETVKMCNYILSNVFIFMFE